MKYAEKINGFILNFLLVWYFFIPFVWINDSTLDMGMKWSYGMVNFLIYAAIIRVKCFGYRYPAIMDFSSFFMLIFWFFFSSYRDAFEPGYSAIERVVYVMVDLLSLAFLADSFLNFLIQIISERFKTRVNIFNTFVKVGLVALFSYLSYQVFRIAK